jgi:hypothetical protein
MPEMCDFEYVESSAINFGRSVDSSNLRHQVIVRNV